MNDFDIGDLLTKLMSENALTEEQLADKLQISRSYLNLIKHGKRSCSDAVALSLKENFDIDLAEISKLKANTSPKNTRRDVIKDWCNQGIGVLTNSHILKAMDYDLLGIEPFNAAQLQPCGYDLSISSIAVKSESADVEIEKREDSKFEHFNIPGGGVITVHAKERIYLSNRIYGHINKTTASLREYNVIVDVGSRIHPGWSGDIQFRLINPTSADVEVDWSALLVAVHFDFLPVPPTLIDGSDIDDLTDDQLIEAVESQHKEIQQAEKRSKRLLRELNKRGVNPRLVNL